MSSIASNLSIYNSGDYIIDNYDSPSNKNNIIYHEEQDTNNKIEHFRGNRRTGRRRGQGLGPRRIGGGFNSWRPRRQWYNNYWNPFWTSPLYFDYQTIPSTLPLYDNNYNDYIYNDNINDKQIQDDLKKTNESLLKTQNIMKQSHNNYLFIIVIMFIIVIILLLKK